MSKWKQLLFAAISIGIGLLFLCIAGEIVLRFLPVARNPLVVPMNATAPVFHYEPNRSFVFSRDWDLHLVNRGWVNNAGMVNNQEYRRNDAVPLLAVIGDSYIEAMMVPYAATLQGRLAKALEGRLRVYSFAASGAPLSQYLIWSRQAVREYGASSLVINVVGNDFDESHDSYKFNFPGFWIYVPNEDGRLQLRRFDFAVGATRSLIKYSALARYLFVNMHLKSILGGVGPFRALVVGDTRTNKPLYAGNTTVDAGEGRMTASLDVIDAFFRDLPEYSGLTPEHILFTIDGFRYPDEAVKGAGTYFDRMRVAFVGAARTRGYEVIDAEPLFLADFRSHGRRFEDPRDRHWNSTAHSIVADAVLGSHLLATAGKK